MEDSFLSVEELSISFGDNNVVRDEMDFVKDEDDDDIRCERMKQSRKTSPGDKKEKQETNKAKSPARTKPNGQQSKYSTLPCLGQAMHSSLAENFERNRAQQDAVWSLCTALNVPSKELSPSISSSDPQLHLCDKNIECKAGRPVLAPLIQDKRQHLQSKHSKNHAESLTLVPKTPPKSKQKRNDKESDHEVHFTPISKSPTFGQEDDSGEKLTKEMIKPKPKFLSPTQGLKEDLSGVDFNQNRRFSLPVSPRLLRRFNKEKLYSSSGKTEGSEKDKDSIPHRGSIFSPPSKEFDSIQDRNEETFIISNDFIPLKVNRDSRRSLDLNSLRFLSEIKVSLGKEPPSPEPVFPKVKTKSEQKKNCYSLSASSEAIFRESLPEVVVPSTVLPQVHSPGRNRASTFTSLETVVPFEPRKLGKTTLEASPVFLDVGNRRLSHLSLSPRLSRKR